MAEARGELSTSTRDPVAGLFRSGRGNAAGGRYRARHFGVTESRVAHFEKSSRYRDRSKRIEPYKAPVSAVRVF